MYTESPSAEYAGETGYMDQTRNKAKAVKALFICKVMGMIQILFWRDLPHSLTLMAPVGQISTHAMHMMQSLARVG